LRRAGIEIIRKRVKSAWERDGSRKKAESGCVGGSDVDILKAEERMEGRMLERIGKRMEEWIHRGKRKELVSVDTGDHDPDKTRIHGKSLERQRKDTRKGQEKDGRMVSFEQVDFRRIRKGEENGDTEGRGMDTRKMWKVVESGSMEGRGKDGGSLL
jgi:hypothetical protein